MALTPETLSAARAWADDLLARMTREEKITLLGGTDYFYTHGIERLGLPGLLFVDASIGVHLRDEFRGTTYKRPLEKSTAFPCTLALASSWDTDLAARYAESIGEECRAGGIAVLLGPGMNIYRHSQCGRNFEYCGEDPYLAGAIAAAYVRGLQSTGTAATMKHFCANNTDYFRRKSNSVVDERTLHEIYLPAFQACIEAGCVAAMTSYNLVNGEWAGQSAFVITELLRRRLGFEGLVMTDWWSVWDGEKVIQSGQDLEMPARDATREAGRLLEEGRVTEAEIDRMVRSYLTAMQAIGAFDRQPEPALLERFPAHAETAYEAALEGCVLLKNEPAALPLPGEGTVLLCGEALDEIVQGGGAAIVEGYDHVTLREALGEALGARLVVKAEPSEADLAAAETVVCNVVTRDSEGWDRPFALPADQEARLQRLTLAHDRVVVLVNSGSGVRMTDWIDRAAAVLYTWYVGQNGFRAVADLLTGKASPSGKLPISIEREFSDSPGHGYIPEGEALYSGWQDEEEGRREVYDLPYDEGVLVGYRWYDAKEIEPLFPFGHGLSYSSFEYSDLRIEAHGAPSAPEVALSFTVTNTGAVAAAEIAQVYVSDPEAAVERPPQELKGFARLPLEPGESRAATVRLAPSAFTYWDPETKDWKFEPGTFRLTVAASSRDPRLETTIEL
ncbi:MAG: beta-glucosidase [Verrucomicrobiota bacterium]